MSSPLVNRWVWFVKSWAMVSRRPFISWRAGRRVSRVTCADAWGRRSLLGDGSPKRNPSMKNGTGFCGGLLVRIPLVDVLVGPQTKELPAILFRDGPLIDQVAYSAPLDLIFLFL